MHGLAGEEAAQVVRHFARGGIPVRGILFERLEADVLQVPRDARIAPSRQHGFLRADSFQKTANGLVAEWRLAREHLVEHATEREDVAARLALALARRLLRRKILRRARDLADTRE